MRVNNDEDKKKKKKFSTDSVILANTMLVDSSKKSYMYRESHNDIRVLAIIQCMSKLLP